MSCGWGRGTKCRWRGGACVGGGGGAVCVGSGGELAMERGGGPDVMGVEVGATYVRGGEWMDVGG